MTSVHHTVEVVIGHVIVWLSVTSCMLNWKRILTNVTLQCIHFAPTLCKALCSVPRGVSRYSLQHSGICIPIGERVTNTNTNNAKNRTIVINPRTDMQ